VTIAGHRILLGLLLSFDEFIGKIQDNLFISIMPKLISLMNADFE